MSAFNFLTLSPAPASTAAVSATRGIDVAPRGGDDTRTFRDELSGVETPRATTARSERDDTSSADTDSRLSAEDADESVGTETQASNNVEDTSSTASNAEADPSVDAQAADDGFDASEDGSLDDPAAGLVAAFEEVLQNTPGSQAVETAVRVAGSPVSGETTQAPLERSTQTINLTQNPEAADDSSALTLGGTITVASSSQNGAAANATAVPTSSDVTAGQALADANTNTDADAQQNNNGGTLNGNAANNAATSTDANRNAAIPLPGFDPTTNNAAAPVLSTSPANPTGTDSARLNPAPGTALTTPTPGTSQATDALNAARLSRGLSNAVNQQGGTVTLRLTPPEFGTVRIQLDLQGTSVSARFHAETDSAQRLLSQQLGQLRATLEAQGLNVERLGVGSLNNSANSSGLQQQSNNDQSQANADGRSRGQSDQSQQNDQSRDDANTQALTSDLFTDLIDRDAEEA